MKYRVKWCEDYRIISPASVSTDFETLEDAKDASENCKKCKIVLAKSPDDIRAEERERCAKVLEEHYYLAAPEILRDLK